MSEAPVPDVSFVIAAYNARDTIGRALDSALAQTGVSLEVIVVDDCSSDGTAELVRYFGDPRVRLIEMETNGGPGAARNVGIDAALGRWIAVLDSDDEIRPDRSAAMIATAGRLDADIVVDNLEVAKPGEAAVTMFARDELTRRPLLTLAEFIGSNVIFRSTFNFGYMKPMFLRAFLEQQGLRFDPGLRIGEDYLLLASALACGGRCAVEPGVGYVYHIREGSISRVLEPRHVEAMIEADRGFVERFSLDPQARQAQRRRTRSLIEAKAFLALVDQIKQRSLAGCLRLAIAHPAALRHLRMPIEARLRRLFVSTARPAKASF